MTERPRKCVFILGGGASLGAHQVGALRLLEEEGIRPDAIVASTIGVINACIYASGGVEQLDRAWQEIGSVAASFRPSLQHNPLTGLSFFSADPLARRIESFMDMPAILASPLEISFILLNLSRGEGQFVSNRQARSARDLHRLVRAGWALPMLFPPIRFRGESADFGRCWLILAFFGRFSRFFRKILCSGSAIFRKNPPQNFRMGGHPPQPRCQKASPA